MNARGGAFLLLSVTLWAVALSTGHTLLRAMAALMAATAAVGLLSAFFDLMTLSIELTTPRRRALRGDTVPVRVRLRLFSLIPASVIEVEMFSPDSGQQTGVMTLSGLPLRGREYRYSVSCPHRGSYHIGVRRVSVTDIFGLFTLRRRVRKRDAYLEVLPRVDEAASPVRLTASDLGTQGRVRVTEDIASPAGVRSWQAGDSLKKVHWKLTASRHELLVRQFEENAKPDVLILLDAAPCGAMRSHQRSIEDSLCEAAVSAANAQMAAGYPVRMPLNTERPSEIAGQSGADTPRFQSALARLEFDSPYPFEQVIMLETRRLQRTGALFLVSARLSATLGDLAARIAAQGVAVRYVWVADGFRADQQALAAQLASQGVPVTVVDPWSAASRGAA